MGALRWEVASQMWVGTDPRRSDLIQELDVLAAAMVKKKKSPFILQLQDQVQVSIYMW